MQSIVRGIFVGQKNLDLMKEQIEFALQVVMDAMSVEIPRFAMDGFSKLQAGDYVWKFEYDANSELQVTCRYARAGCTSFLVWSSVSSLVRPKEERIEEVYDSLEALLQDMSKRFLWLENHYRAKLRAARKF